MSPAKRTLDVLVALGGIVLALPAFVVVAAVIKLADGGPVFYRQERVGHRGRVFRMWKFRTMVPDAAVRGPALTLGNDPRVTPVGAWLRRFKLDELPQLFNVLVGDMSCVGPRPEVARYVASYGAAERAVLELVPGITDLASIRFADEGTLLAAVADPERVYVDEIVPEKVRLNLAYAARATVWSDIGVILATVRRVASRAGMA